MLAERQRPQSIRIRYYLATEQGLFRLPQRLHQDLINGKRSLRQFASSDQRVLEVFARQLTASTFVVSAHGVVYRFDQHGGLILDVRDALDDLLNPVSEGNVVKLDRAKRARARRERSTWKPSRSLIDLVKHDIVRTSKSPRPIPVLRPRM